MLECSPLGDIGGGCSPVGGSVALGEQSLRRLEGTCGGSPVLHSSQGEIVLSEV